MVGFGIKRSLDGSVIHRYASGQNCELPESTPAALPDCHTKRHCAGAGSPRRSCITCPHASDCTTNRTALKRVRFDADDHDVNDSLQNTESTSASSLKPARCVYHEWPPSTSDDRRRAWMAKPDFLRIRADNRSAILAFQSHQKQRKLSMYVPNQGFRINMEKWNDNVCSVRGLEHHVNSVMYRSALMKQRFHSKSVVNTYQLLTMDLVEEPAASLLSSIAESVRETSMKISAPDRAHAARMGELDTVTTLHEVTSDGP
jgi:hypothetical protein